MSLVVEIPLQHPARRQNPYQLKKANAPLFLCPLGCGQGFNERWNLDLHLMEKHPDRGQAKTKIEWW